MRTPSKIRCLYLLLITLSITIMVSPPGATAYVIYPASFATPGDDDGRFLLDDFEPGSPLPSNPDYGFALSPEMNLPVGPDHPYPFDIYDIGDAFFPHQDDELSSSWDHISSDLISSTSDTVSPNPDSTLSYIDSSSFDPVSQGPDTISPSSGDFFPISASSENDGFLLAHGHSEPHCNGDVALCCRGVRYLDGSLVENCHYWSTDSSPCMERLEVDCCESYIESHSQYGCVTSFGLHCTRARL